MEKRPRKLREPQEKPEGKPTKPTEIWSWDLTYLALGPIVFYLFIILDGYSPKIVAWHLSWNATVESRKRAWDQAFSNEDLWGVGEEPKLLLIFATTGFRWPRRQPRNFSKNWALASSLPAIRPLQIIPGLRVGFGFSSMTGWGLGIISLSIS